MSDGSFPIAEDETRRDRPGADPSRGDESVAASCLSDVETTDSPNTRSRRKPESLEIAEQPFVVQAGSTLFMFAVDDSQWTLAELVFDAPSCTFVEANRAHYGWPREAFGAMLSRVMVDGAMDAARIDRLTDDFQEWLAQQFARHM